MHNPLFSGSPWSAIEDRRLAKVPDEVGDLDQTRVLNTPVEGICELLLQGLSFRVPTLDEDKIEIGQSEVRVLNRDPYRLPHDRSSPSYITRSVVEVYVPFSGDADLFTVRPKAYTSDPPRAELTTSRKSLVIHVFADLDESEVKREIRSTIQRITAYLDSLRNDVHAFESNLRRVITDQVRARRNGILRQRDLASSLGYAVREPKNTAKTLPEPEASGHPSPGEPSPADIEFERIITIIEQMFAVVERDPRAFLTSDEETLRTHILVQLNGHYKGSASGETFNCNGKTDILIRVDGENVFIAECKFWSGPKSLTAAIDQLLSYAGWHDTKVAVILFNRQRNFTRVRSEIPRVVAEHRCYKRPARGESSDAFRYVMTRRDDPSRELTLAVVPFDVPSNL